MCRWAAYVGKPIFLEDIVSRPGHSLIRQSHCATQCSSAINADGFGIAWYGERPEPGLYRDIYPAWSDPNLRTGPLGPVFGACAGLDGHRDQPQQLPSVRGRALDLHA